MRDLVEQAAKGDQAAFESLVRASAGRLFGIAYRVTRALHRGESALGARLPQARETTAANTVLAAPSPDRLHPGTRRYLAELGLLRSP